MINEVFHMDCLEGMKMIPDKSVDMILCDLPYGTTACKWDVVIPFEPLWKQYERVIKDNGAIILSSVQPFSSLLGSSNIKKLKYSWVWEKTRGGGFLNAKKQPLKGFEDILVFYYKNPTYNPQGVLYAPKRIKNSKYLQNVSEPTSTVTGSLKKDFIQEYTNYPKGVIKISSEGNTVHPTQKPVSLFEYLIKTYTNEGETVLDNCMGSGTTAIACINTNRNYIGFEKDEKYFNIIQERIKKHKESKTQELFA